MIPSHILDNLGPQDRVAIFARGGELYFLVHGTGDTLDVIREGAARDGSEVLATHMRDKGAILEFIAGRERDLGGEA